MAIPFSRSSLPSVADATRNSVTKTSSSPRGIARAASVIQRRTSIPDSARRGGKPSEIRRARHTRVSPRSKRTKGFVTVFSPADTTEGNREFGPKPGEMRVSESPRLPPLRVIFERDFRSERCNHLVVVVVRGGIQLRTKHRCVAELVPEDLRQPVAVIGALENRASRQATRDHGISDPESGNRILKTSGFADEHCSVPNRACDRVF